MKKAIFIILPLLFLACSGPIHLRERDVEVPVWPVPRGDCANWASAGRAEGELVELWRTNLKVPILATPTAGEGAVFIGTGTRRMMAVDAETGEKIGNIWTDVAVEDGLTYSDGRLVIAGRSIYNKLRCYDVFDGGFLWSKKSDRAASSPIICGDRIFYSTAVGALFALDLESGEKIWRVGLEDAVIENEPGFRDSLLFVADQNGALYCIAADSGVVRWRIDIPKNASGPPVVIPDHVIVPAHSGRIPVITLDGVIRVEIHASGELIAPVACSGPTIFGVTRRGICFAGDLGEGGILWQTDIGEPSIVGPIIWGKDIVTIGASGRISLIHYGTGEIESQLETNAPISAEPIIYDSKMFLATEEGELIAIGKSKKETEIQNER